jgi:hypothetical protein
VTQDASIVLAFKVVEVASVVTIATFVGCYTWWTKGKCWSNPIGQTIVLKDIALVLVLIPSLLSIFIDFNRLTSHIAAWFDVASFAAVPVIMVWRVIAWRKIHKAGHLQQGGSDEGGTDA